MYEIIATTLCNVEAIFDELLKAKIIAVDTETDGLDYMTNNIIGISFATKNMGAYLPMDKPWPSSVLANLKNILENENKFFIYHNYGFDTKMFKRLEINARCDFDTMIASWCLDENRRHGLKSLAKSLLNAKDWAINFKHTPGKTLPLEQLGEYAIKDAQYTFRLAELMQPLIKIDSVKKNYYRKKHNLQAVLNKMEFEGMKIDISYVQQLKEETEKQIQDLDKQMRKACTEEILHIENELFTTKLAKFKTLQGKKNQIKDKFNFDSQKQIALLLYNHLGLKSNVKTDKGSASTSSGALLELKDKNKVVPYILKYRELKKLLSTYLIPIAESFYSDERIRTNFRITGTKTGRLSSSKIGKKGLNFQNIPRSSRIRNIFIADAGKKFVIGDFAQLEPRIAAHYADDKGLFDAFANNKDFYQYVAKKLNIERQLAKIVSLAILYGAGSWKISKLTGLNRFQTSQLIKDYWKTFSKFKELYNKVHSNYKVNSKYTNCFGNTRNLPDYNLNSPDMDKIDVKKKKSRAFQQAVNSLIQGTASDILMISMINLDYNLSRFPEFNAKLVNQIHDEIIVECDERYADEVSSIMKSTMEDIPEIKCPLFVKPQIVNKWGEVIK